MDISQDHVVTFHVTASTSDGRVVTDTHADGPLTYLHGYGQLVAGLEAALSGRQPGEQFSISVDPEAAYGAYDSELDLALPWEVFPADMRDQMGPGMSFHAEHPDPRHDGEVVTFTISRVEKERVLASGNHPLAGESLNFEVEVLNVRAASADEIAAGHADHPAGPTADTN